VRVIGIIAEYNPLHLGHEYLIKEAKRIVGDPRAVVMSVMSGSFTQRGLPSIAPKHIRARQALLTGNDVVIELPFTFACAPSERFAFGAVELLYRTGVVTDLAFGVDCQEPELLYELASLTPDDDEIKLKLSEGKSYPAARAAGLIKAYKGDLPEAIVADTLRQPNSILALDYIRACRDLNTGFKIHMIPRQEGMSATAARKALDEADKNSVSEVASALENLMPEKSLSVMLSSLTKKEFSLYDYDLYMRECSLEVRRCRDLNSVAYMTDGLDGYLRNKADKGFDELATKHFTMPRIHRALASLITGQTGEYTKREKHVQYIRVLGFSSEGRYCLKIMSKCARLPIISNPSDALELYSDHPRLKEQFELDLLSCDVYARLTGMENGYEWQVPPVKVK